MGTLDHPFNCRFRALCISTRPRVHLACVKWLDPLAQHRLWTFSRLITWWKHVLMESGQDVRSKIYQTKRHCISQFTRVPLTFFLTNAKFSGSRWEGSSRQHLAPLSVPVRGLNLCSAAALNFITHWRQISWGSSQWRPWPSHILNILQWIATNSPAGCMGKIFTALLSNVFLAGPVISSTTNHLFKFSLTAEAFLHLCQCPPTS